jgi:hypothetical protein
MMAELVKGGRGTACKQANLQLLSGIEGTEGRHNKIEQVFPGGALSRPPSSGHFFCKKKGSEDGRRKQINVQARKGIF